MLGVVAPCRMVVGRRVAAGGAPGGVRRVESAASPSVRRKVARGAAAATPESAPASAPGQNTERQHREHT